IADDLDPLNVFEDQVLGVPVNARKCRVVNRSPIDEHQQFVGEPPVESSGRDGPSVGSNLRYFEPRRHPQKVWNIRRARTADFFLRDDIHSGGGFSQLLLFFWDGSNVDIHQVFQAGLGKIRRGTVLSPNHSNRDAQNQGCNKARQITQKWAEASKGSSTKSRLADRSRKRETERLLPG